MARRCGWSGILMWLAAFGAMAAGPTPGEYGTKQGWGSLQVSDKGGARHFEMLAVGANGHTCSLEGTLRGDTAEVSDASDTPCKLAFKPVAGGFSIAALTPDSCRDYCGMRASFEGDYLKLPAGCTSAASSRRREAYLRDYRGKRYSEALAGMQAFAGECGEFLNWLDRDRFANDRALTLLRLNRPQECLAALDQTMAGRSRDEASFQAEMDKDSTMLPPIAKSTWFNRKLCEAAKG
ncbi:hypothetical protein [Xanthomonas citri]|uniref:hypothetical protein n=1 Tax=Xanthomonas citri TaxID=346 RepID=UPI00159950DB|nr:hypothetical protein [Xanthomonas citri]MBE0316658.1 hypothetical protein [Xanthomonas citri pv. punicae]MDS0830457.1 hypothetical protein [Xanthomonas citri pv. punicae]MDS0834253.1 hypothetical protein [Xanthomonas citri pv. punicae]QCZ73248.1 hypothetical protein CAB38_11130 [Xanthomonas citri pv. punicae]